MTTNPHIEEAIKTANLIGKAKTLKDKATLVRAWASHIRMATQVAQLRG